MRLPELIVSAEAAGRLREEAAKLPAWDLAADQLAGLGLLMTGALLPLRGYPGEMDANRIAGEMRLASGALWPLPLPLTVDEAFAGRIAPGDDIALRAAGVPLAIMSVTDLWQADGWHLGGRVKGLTAPDAAGPSPNALRARFAARGLAQVVAVDRVSGDLPARAGGAHLLIQPFAGEGLAEAEAFVAAAPEGAASLATVAIAPGEGLAGLLTRALIHRNHGATHVMVNDAEQAEALRSRAEELAVGVWPG